MRLVVDHLTRMSGQFICLAGFDETSRCYVRPLLRGSRLTTDHLASGRGVFDLGSVIDIKSVEPQPSPPEVEDLLFSLAQASLVTQLTPAEFWRGLSGRAIPRLRIIFGDDLARDGRTCAVDPQGGKASLGCLGPSRVRILLEPYGERRTLRLELADDDYGDLLLPVTDLRCFRAGQPDEKTINWLDEHLDQPVLLSVGLTRPYQPPGKTLRHWLQVNNIHIPRDPLWGVPVGG